MSYAVCQTNVTASRICRDRRKEQDTNLVVEGAGEGKVIALYKIMLTAHTCITEHYPPLYLNKVPRE
jgi:hypothetical protein